MATTFFSIIVLTHLRNDSLAFKINSSDILFHSSSIAVLSEPIFRWEVAFVLFSKTLHIASSRRLKYGLKYCLIAVLTVFSWTFNPLACFLIDVVGSFLITDFNRFFKSILHFPFPLKKLFFSKKKKTVFSTSYMLDKEILTWFQH